MDDASAVEDLPRRIDHTVLGPRTTPAEVDRAVETADRLGTNVCVPPYYVDRAAGRLDDGAVVTVVGFPHGQYARSAVVAEAQAAANDGADELDAVVNVGRIQAATESDSPDGSPSESSVAEAVHADLAAIVDATDLPVKAIVCAPLLDRPELELACELAAGAGCSHVKTATGFNSSDSGVEAEAGGATIEDIRVMANYLPVKASGGIGSWDEARAMLEAGAERIGASSGDVIVAEWREATGRSD